ncbi:MAG TPA: outer membrane beta-barrel protein [Burkholderiales bacterium]|nr:outer membrane beta-barrel protein [Burkholderiales bacterium]
MKPHSLWLVAAIMSSVGMAAMAADKEKNFYVGLGAGSSNARLDADKINGALIDEGFDTTTSTEHVDTSVKLYGGYRFSRFLAAEIGLTDLGRFRAYSKSPATGDTFSGSTEAYSLDVSILGMLPLGESFSLFLRGGASAWTTRLKAAARTAAGVTSDSDSETGVSPLAGAGLAYRYSPELSFRVEFERHFSVGKDVELAGVPLDYKAPVDLISLAVQYSF